jgi:hypothetical protein
MTADVFEHHPGGLSVLKCLIDESGLVHDCVVLNSVPGLDQKIIEAYRSARYEPIFLQGKPVAVYTQINTCIATAARVKH